MSVDVTNWNKLFNITIAGNLACVIGGFTGFKIAIAWYYFISCLNKKYVCKTNLNTQNIASLIMGFSIVIATNFLRLSKVR